MISTSALPQELTQVLFSPEQLQEKIAELGAQITSDYHDKELILLCVLKGSTLFCADLMRCVDLRLKLDFISISSYGESTKSSGVVKIVKDMEENIRDKHVLVVEDIVDTGLTLNYLMDALRVRGPASAKICSLLSKPSRRKVEVPIDYLGFTIDDHFVVGYGLDYCNLYRNLPYIGILDPGQETAG